LISKYGSVFRIPYRHSFLILHRDNLSPGKK
jgi:hypothetical protein